MTDGPWRVAPLLHVALVGGSDEAAAALGAVLARAGLPLGEARAVRPGDLGPLTPLWGTAVDLLVLDARTTIGPAGVAELRRVADIDPMIAAVSPGFDAAGPEVTYTLLADPRCLYLKGSVMADLAPSTAAAPDLAGLLLDLNRFGFRVVLAGRAAAQHPEVPHAAAVPPAWKPALARHARSAPQRAARLMAGLRPGAEGRRAVAFDLSHLGLRHSGTSGLAVALVRRAVARWPDLALSVVADAPSFAFHFGADPDVLRHDPADPRVFAALIRFGQPFLWREIDAAARRAPVLVLFMLDTIGLDCARDAPDELDALWRFCLAEADGLLFNSAFTGRQFARRFTVPPDIPALPSLHSLDLADYRVAPAPAGPGDTVLVVGNAMPHKRLRETAALLAGAGLPCPVVVLGLEPGAVPGVTAMASGGVSPERLAALYGAARVVVYPSVYEGFGFPLLEALAHRRPILARALPPYAEIAAGLPESANIHTFADDADLLRRLADPPAWTDARVAVAPRTWDDAADDLRAVLDQALDRASTDRVMRRIDGLRGRMSYMRGLALGDEAAEDLDRLAGLAGRLARDGVGALGRRLPAGLLRLASRALKGRR